MPHTVPVAELVGGIVGIAVGRFCAKHGREIAREWGWPEAIGGFAGASIGHYLSGCATKVCINTMGLDVIGAGLSVGVTTPATALTHGLVEGLAAGLQDLGLGSLLDEFDLSGFVRELVTSPDLQPHLDALSDFTGDSMSGMLADPSDLQGDDLDLNPLLSEYGAMPAPNAHPLDGLARHDEVRFSGSQQPIALIADSQGRLPTCGLESLENMAQAKNAMIGNHLSDWVIQSGWYNPASGGFPPAWYQHVLSQCDIASQWVDANLQSLWNAVTGVDTTAAVMGDPYFLSHELYGAPGKLHAITLIERWIDPEGSWIGFIGIDSNVSGQPSYWSFDQINAFIEAGRHRLGAWGGKALVTL